MAIARHLLLYNLQKTQHAKEKTQDIFSSDYTVQQTATAMKKVTALMEKQKVP